MREQSIKMFKETGECPRKCRKWSGCSGKDFYDISEICYCFNQVEWLILNFLRCEGNEIRLERDTWPESRLEVSPGLSSHAPFEMVMMTIGELRARLVLTGLSGRILVLEYCQGIQLSDAAKWARGYVAGNKRKNRSFSQWRSDKKRQKSDKNMCSNHRVLTKPYLRDTL